MSSGDRPGGGRDADGQGEPAPGYRRVRVLCEDAAGRMLLLKWRDPVSGRVFYEPPGGGIEPGETPAQAALRELNEETGLPGPISAVFVPVERFATWKGQFRHETEPFFLARCEAPEVLPAALTESESETLLGWCWASAAGDLDAPLDPPEAFDVLRRLRRLVP